MQPYEALAGHDGLHYVSAPSLRDNRRKRVLKASHGFALLRDDERFYDMRAAPVGHDSRKRVFSRACRGVAALGHDNRLHDANAVLLRTGGQRILDAASCAIAGMI